MMKHEFEELAGYEVSCEDYNNIIEPMYMATNLNKLDFIKCIDKKRFALPTKREMIKKMRKIAAYIYENCGRESFYKEKNELEELSRAYAKRFYNLKYRDIDSYWYFNTKYAYCGCIMDRGCSFPYELVLGKDDREYERITLVKC